MKRRRVAITGLGAVSCFGADVPAFWDGIRGAHCGIRPIARIAAERLRIRSAAEITDFKAADHFERRQSDLLDLSGQIAVVSAREAAAQAGVSRDDLHALGHRAGVIYGASTGIHTLDECYRVLGESSTGRIHPFSLPKISSAGPACGISIDRGVRGQVFGVTSACATGAHAIGVAFDLVRAGRLDVCLTGASDISVVYGAVKSWEALRLLSPDLPRPFSRDRNGTALGEGAATLVLEAWEHAQARGATILAEVMGFGMSADAADMLSPDSGSAAFAMRAAIEDAELTPADIGYVNAHGTGTKRNDKSETTALKKIFNGAMPPVSASKSQFGHGLHAAGALEAITTVLAMRADLLPATINFREPDPECEIDCVPNATRAARYEFAMSNSFGFGGLNAVLVFRREGGAASA